MLILQSFIPVFGEPSASPFCTKAMCLLDAAGADWAVDYDVDLRKTPMQKLPVLLDGDTVIADSSLIRAHLEAKGADFDPGLDNATRARAHAVARMVEEHLYFGLVHSRWAVEESWVHLRQKFFGPVPPPLRGFIANKVRKGVLSNLYAQGLGRFDEAGLVERVDHDLCAIAELIGNQAFLFGDQLTSADYSAGPILSSLANLPSATMLGTRVECDAVLMGYVQRFREAAYERISQLPERIAA